MAKTERAQSPTKKLAALLGMDPGTIQTITIKTSFEGTICLVIRRILKDDEIHLLQKAFSQETETTPEETG